MGDGARTLEVFVGPHRLVPVLFRIGLRRQVGSDDVQKILAVRLSGQLLKYGRTESHGLSNVLVIPDLSALRLGHLVRNLIGGQSRSLLHVVIVERVKGTPKGFHVVAHQVATNVVDQDPAVLACPDCLFAVTTNTDSATHSLHTPRGRERSGACIIQRLNNTRLATAQPVSHAGPARSPLGKLLVDGVVARDRFHGLVDFAVELVPLEHALVGPSEPVHESLEQPHVLAVESREQPPLTGHVLNELGQALLVQHLVLFRLTEGVEVSHPILVAPHPFQVFSPGFLKLLFQLTFTDNLEQLPVHIPVCFVVAPLQRVTKPLVQQEALHVALKLCGTRSPSGSLMLSQVLTRDPDIPRCVIHHGGGDQRITCGRVHDTDPDAHLASGTGNPLFGPVLDHGLGRATALLVPSRSHLDHNNRVEVQGLPV